MLCEITYNVIKIYIQIADYRLQTIVYSKINVEIKIKLYEAVLNNSASIKILTVNCSYGFKSLDFLCLGGIFDQI